MKFEKVRTYSVLQTELARSPLALGTYRKETGEAVRAETVTGIVWSAECSA